MYAGAVELRNGIQEALATDLPSTLTFDYPTIALLVEFLGKKADMNDSATTLVAVDSKASSIDATVILPQLQGIVLSSFGINVEAEQPLSEAGIDSLSTLCPGFPRALPLGGLTLGGQHDAGAVELSTAISELYNIELPATLVFDYPSLDVIARHLTSVLALRVPARAALSASSMVPHEPDLLLTTVVGLSATFADHVTGKWLAVDVVNSQVVISAES